MGPGRDDGSFCRSRGHKNRQRKIDGGAIYGSRPLEVYGERERLLYT